MTDYTTIEEQAEYGLETVADDRLADVPLRDLLYVHQVMGELVRFFHQPLHYPDLASVERFLGDRKQGMIPLLFDCYYDKLRNMLPPDIREQIEAGNFNHPDPPFYYRPQEDIPSTEGALTMNLTLRPLKAGDIEPIAQAFAAIGWNKPAAQYARYLAEQEQGTRHVLVAFADGAFAGYLTVVWRSGYPGFQARDIPEIQDFNVLPHLQRQGIGTRLMEAAESLIASRSRYVGIGVGMTVDYGAAQRLYVRRGYIPDGNGLMYDNRPLSYGESVTVDDALVLHLIKDLGSQVETR